MHMKGVLFIQQNLKLSDCKSKLTLLSHILSIQSDPDSSLLIQWIMSFCTYLLLFYSVSQCIQWNWLLSWNSLGKSLSKVPNECYSFRKSAGITDTAEILMLLKAVLESSAPEISAKVVSEQGIGSISENTSFSRIQRDPFR